MPRVCPQCGSEKIRGASLHTHDGVRRLLFYTPLRCRDCRHRFWTFNPLKPILLLAAASAVVGVTAWLALEPSASIPAAQEPISLPHARAEKGDAEAQLQLGMRYAEGDGVIQNDKEATKWFALAAQQGLPEAQYQYGLALLRGRGIVQDYRAAFNWIEKPAQRGYARAQYSLGELVSSIATGPVRRSTRHAPTCGTTSPLRRAWKRPPRRATAWSGSSSPSRSPRCRKRPTA